MVTPLNSPISWEFSSSSGNYLQIDPIHKKAIGKQFLDKDQEDSLSFSARERFSEILYEKHKSENPRLISRRFVKIFNENIQDIKQMEDINDIAHLIFGKYLDTEINEALPKILKEIPDLANIFNFEERLKDEFRIQAHMFHGIGIQPAMKKVIHANLPNKFDKDAKIDLRRRLD